MDALLLYWEGNRCDNHGTLNRAYADDLLGRFQEFTATPFYIAEELKEFQGGSIVNATYKVLAHMEKSKRRIKETGALNLLSFGEGCNSSFDPVLSGDTLLKLYTAVSSRTFGIIVRERNISDIYCVPIIDLVNTEPNPNSHVLIHNLEEFRIVTKKSVKAGDEITIEYPSNMNYMYHYGFCMDNNTHSHYKFRIIDLLRELAGDLKSPSERKEFLNELNTHRNDYGSLRLSKRSTLRQLPNRLLNFIRALTADDRLSALDMIENGLDEFSIKSERSMFKILKWIFTRLLHAYPTTSQQDQALIDKGIPNYKIYCATIIRRDEKMILQRTLDMIKVESKSVSRYLADVIKSKVPEYLRPLKLFGKTKDYWIFKKVSHLEDSAVVSKKGDYVLVKWLHIASWPTFDFFKEKFNVETSKDYNKEKTLAHYLKISLKDHSAVNMEYSEFEKDGQAYWYIGLNKGNSELALKKQLAK